MAAEGCHIMVQGPAATDVPEASLQNQLDWLQGSPPQSGPPRPGPSRSPDSDLSGATALQPHTQDLPGFLPLLDGCRVLIILRSLVTCRESTGRGLAVGQPPWRVLRPARCHGPLQRGICPMQGSPLGEEGSLQCIPTEAWAPRGLLQDTGCA